MKANERALQGMLEDARESARRVREDTLAAMLADTEALRANQRNGSILCFVVAAVMGMIASAIWLWGGTSDPDFFVWTAGIGLGGGFACDAAKVMTEKLLRRLEERVTLAGFAIRWDSVEAVSRRPQVVGKDARAWLGE